MKQIAAQELYRYIGNDSAWIIDLRNYDSYAKKHIRGAKNIPIEKIEDGTHNLPRDKEIILYCERGGLSSMAAGILESQGYRAKSVVGGMDALKIIDNKYSGL